MTSAAHAYRDWHRTLANFKAPAELHPCDWCGNWASRWCYQWNRPNDEQGSKRYTFVPDSRAYAPLCSPCQSALNSARRRLNGAELAAALPALRLAARDMISDTTRATVLEDTARRRATAVEPQITTLGKPSRDAVRATNDLLRQAYGG